MNKLSIDIRIALLLAVGLTLVFYWDLFTMVSTPMSGPLQDPAVSHWVYIPSIKTLRYELFNHFNILWSNLRGLGMPILVNDVQAAPMYPLTLLLIWLPDESFWNVFVLARWLIFASGSYLLASRCFQFNLAGSSIFVLTFVFALYHARWSNHALLNGMAAGVWYLYFTLATLNTDQYQNYFRRHIGLLWGLVISAYSVITCGFPEASVTIAFATILITPFAFYRFVKTDHRLAVRALGLIVVGNVLGIAIASPQILALVEITGLSSDGFRTAHALNQYDTPIIDFLLGKLTLIGPRPPDPNIHAFGLIPTYLFLFGLSYTLTSREKQTWGQGALIACGLFFLLKNFPVFGNYFPLIDTLHRGISSIPVIQNVWFTSYSFPLLLLFFSFFAGAGAHSLSALIRESTKPSQLKIGLWIIILMLIVLILVNLASQTLNHMYYLDTLRKYEITRKVAAVFSIFCITIAYIFITKFRGLKTVSWIPIVGLALLEHTLILPDDFGDRKDYSREHTLSKITDSVKTIIDDHKLEPHNFRFADFGTTHFGFFLGNGYSTFRNGAAAMYTSRQQAYRSKVLGAKWNGFFPVLGIPDRDGWARSSASLHIISTEDESKIGHRILTNLDPDIKDNFNLINHNSLKLDRVGCGASLLEPDGFDDNVFSLDINLPSYPDKFRAIVNIDLVRKIPWGINRTSQHNNILGVSLGKNSSFLNNTIGSVDIPLNSENPRLWLFACNDGHDQPTTEYAIHVTLDRGVALQKLGQPVDPLGLPTSLLTSMKIDEYIHRVLLLAGRAGGDPKLIERHAIDLETAVKKSTTKNLAIGHSLHFLRGVGAKIRFDAYDTDSKFIVRDLHALPRAYIPFDCTGSINEADSLRKITNNQFRIGQSIVEFPTKTSTDVCEKHRSTIRPVNISSDLGSRMSLEPIEGPNVLILNDNYYPGWKAIDTLSKEEIAIYPANLTFRAMLLPEKRQYQLELRYWPSWLSAALAISLVVLIVLTGVTIIARWRT
ncbi:MAG: hypothetical protein VYC65_01775 [Chloroflexota bacterium]|nr:hypothetical protein [Chloroflexota bacterium]